MWSTSVIEAFLKKFGLFYPNDRKEFKSQIPFLSISLMKVKSYDSWSSKDYDPEHTNYIAIVTSDDWYYGVKKDPEIHSVFTGLESLLNTNIEEDW